MAGGKAHGQDRQYQVQCRDVLRHRCQDLKPLAGDGIDVALPLGGTTWTLDIALEAVGGDLVVAECRRRRNSVKQEELAAFAYKVELLRKHLARPVAGVFFAKTGVQLGAVKVGDFEGITVAVLDDTAVPPGFALAFHRYDRDRERRCIDLVVHVPGNQLTLTGLPSELVVGIPGSKGQGPQA